MKYPIRHRNHQLETKSANFLRSAVPIDWVLNTFQSDYGTDFHCELSRDSGVNGTSFFIQLKSKEAESGIDEIVIHGIKRSSINRWLKMLEPVMLAVYVESERKMFWSWITDSTFDLTRKHKTFEMRIPRRNTLIESSWSEIQVYVEKVFNKRHLIYEIPKPQDELESEAWDYYFRGDLDTALIKFKTISAEKIDQDPAMLNCIAMCEYSLFHYQEALISINRALDLVDNAVLRINKASILTELGFTSRETEMFELAEEIYQNLLGRANDPELLFYNYANCLRGLGKFQLSIQFYQQALEMNPNNAEAWKNLGAIFSQLRDHEREMACYENALLIDPNLYEASFSKGVTLAIVYGKAQEGLELMLKAESSWDKKLFPIANRHGYFWIAEVYFRIGDTTIAKKWNAKGVELYPGDGHYKTQLDRFNKVSG